jgi:uncharacterized repeat protein (TIGR01451 family)
MKATEHERRDWTIVVIILLIGFLCVILAGQWALRFPPSWKLNANMGSNLNPNGGFIPQGSEGFLEPLDPSILTPPAWINVYLTPGASFQTRTPVPAIVNTLPAPSNTPPPPTSTAETNPSPTSILSMPTWTPINPVIIPSTPTSTPGNPPILSTDLQITKTDNVTTYTAGSTLIYTVTVINNGTNNVTGAVVTDNKPPQITTWTWACTGQNGGATGCSTLTNSSENFNDTVNLPNGASIVYTVTANIASGATGNLTNTAVVSVPAGFSDPNSANNSATDIDAESILPISTDLSISKTDGNSTYRAGGTVTYTITVSNNGPNDVADVTVIDNKPSQITTWSWTCASQNGGATGCDGVANSGVDFNDTVSLPSGSSIVYTVISNISSTASGDLVNTAEAHLPTQYSDPIPGNNSATDTDVLMIADPIPPQIGTTPDNDYYPLPAGGTLTLNIPTTVNGHAGWDLVYYEWINQGEVYLDWIRVEIGDGINWYLVFDWGNEAPDRNTNMNFEILPPPVFSAPPPPEEYDQRHIPSGSLYNMSGIAIDLDGMAPPGIYPYVRFTAPIGDRDGRLEIDAIVTLP